MPRSVSRTRTVNAPANVIFDLLADPSRHAEIDGSGSIVKANDATPKRLSKGAHFGMSMKVGVPYKIENTVVDFDENVRIAWKHFGGHVWGYDLAAGATAGTTEVTETFDWSTSKSPFFLELMRYPKKNTKSIEKTLDKLVARFA
jgi:Polyketide cyclase / dehydrase and lipid transport